MKRLVVYYSLSGNTEEAAKRIAGETGADIVKLETVKSLPKSFAGQILVGGAQVAMKIVPEIKPIDADLSSYDEIILGTPIWNSKGVPAINAFLKDESSAKKVTSLFMFSGGGETKKAVNALVGVLPNLKNTVALIDRKQEDSKNNDAKISKFIEDIIR